ncbi:hypothetical protein [Streptomyces sp. NPDC059080]|uniref:hypothetical protein n=1 Tax=Streptomyces sp. NPDC059080 TaxID=3346718 RepID=UPI00368F4E7A
MAMFWIRITHYRIEFKRAVIEAGDSQASRGQSIHCGTSLPAALSLGVSLLEVSRWPGRATMRITADIYR